MSVKVSEGSSVRVQARRGDHLGAYARLADWEVPKAHALYVSGLTTPLTRLLVPTSSEAEPHIVILV